MAVVGKLILLVKDLRLLDDKNTTYKSVNKMFCLTTLNHIALMILLMNVIVHNVKVKITMLVSCIKAKLFRYLL